MRVVAAALLDGRGRVLIAERPAGKALAGQWEFPGGKMRDGEDDGAALRRELREELGIELLAAEPSITLVHRYAEREVELRFHRVTAWHGEPRGLEGQRLQWVPIERLNQVPILEADRPFIMTLQQGDAVAR